MQIYLECKDNGYRQALIAYYKKNYDKKMDLIFSYQENAFILRDYTDFFQSEKKHIRIRKYQNMKDFFEQLSLLEFDMIAGKPFEVIGFSSFFSGSGTTLLSLNMAKLLSESKRTIWFSLEPYASTDYYNIYHNLSTTDLLFYMNHNPNYLQEALKEEGLTLLSGVTYASDLEAFSAEQFLQALDILKKVGYERVIVDCSNYHDLQLDQHFYVTKNEELQFSKMKHALKTYLHQAVLINQRREDQIVDVFPIQGEEKYYIDYVHRLEDNKWESSVLQKRLKEVLNMR